MTAIFTYIRPIQEGCKLIGLRETTNVQEVKWCFCPINDYLCLWGLCLAPNDFCDKSLMIPGNDNNPVTFLLWWHIGIVAGNPRVTQPGPHPYPHLPVPATRTGLPVETSPKTVRLSDKTLYFTFCDSQSHVVTVTPTVLYSPIIYLSPSITWLWGPSLTRGRYESSFFYHIDLFFPSFEMTLVI